MCQVLLARRHGLRATVWSGPRLVKERLECLLAVGGGSVHKPCLAVLEYRPRRRGCPKVAIVGKAITFDSGGLDIKPSSSMEGMKADKAGGCAVLATVATAARLALPIRVLGYVPMAENMPSGSSYRPSDVIRTSFLEAQTGPLFFSALLTMVLNLITLKGRPKLSSRRRSRFRRSPIISAGYVLLSRRRRFSPILT